RWPLAPFFFSSRRRHTRWPRDWSSDVCSSDLGGALVTSERSPLGQSGVGFAYEEGRPLLRLHFPYREEPLRYDGSEAPEPSDIRSEERRVGKEGRGGGLACEVVVLVVGEARGG